MGVISEGVIYQQIRDSLPANAVRFNRFRFMGSTQALISFASYDAKMEALKRIYQRGVSTLTN